MTASEVRLAPTAADHELIAYAKAIVDRSGDGLVHTMGAAVRDRAGTVYGGINLYHFTGGPCAELVVLGSRRGQCSDREPAAVGRPVGRAVGHPTLPFR